MFKFVDYVKTNNGDFMKKTLLLLVFLLLVSFSYKEKTDYAFLEKENFEDTNYQHYYLLFDNLTTKNFNTIFNNNINIITIYPKSNQIYSNKQLRSYDFLNSNLNYNINNFIKFYNKFLDENGLGLEKDKAIVNGIEIEKVKVYTSSEEIYNFLKKNPKVIFAKN